MNYHSRPELNWSRLKSGAVSAKHLRQVLESEPKPPTPAMELGTAIHCAVLEPERFANEYTSIGPDLSGLADLRDGKGKPYKAPHLSDAGKALIAEATEKWRAENPGVTLLTEEQIETLMLVRDSVLAHEDARLWLESSDLIEHEVFWQESVDAAGVVLPVDCRMKADGISRKLGLLWDLKSIGTSQTPLSVDRCVKAIALSLYHGQLGYYTRGLAKSGIDVQVMGWIFVESTAPYDVVVIQADADMMAKGYELAEKLLQRYATAKVTGRWPGVSDRAVVCGLPKWGDAQVEVDGDSLAAWGI